MQPPSWGGLRWTMLGLGFFGFAGSCTAAMMMERQSGFFIVFCLFAAVGVYRLARAYRQATQNQIRPMSPPRAVASLLFGAFYFVLGMALPFFMGFFARGRQPRRWGRALLPRVEPGTDWSQLPLTPEVDATIRKELAAQWRDLGRTEHASVAAFSRLSLDLIALGAPPRLIRDAHRDALDEIRHAEICFSLARQLDGEERSPAPFPQVQHAGGLPPGRTLGLVKLAVHSMIDGALHEGISARLIAATLQRCTDPAIHEALIEILRDEGRHAADGWRVVEWCVAEGGAPIVQALQGAARRIPEHAPTELPSSARGGAWEVYGVPGEQTEARERAASRLALLRRVRNLSVFAESRDSPRPDSKNTASQVNRSVRGYGQPAS